MVGKAGQGGPESRGWYPGALEGHVRIGVGDCPENCAAHCVAPWGSE
ncbi:protein of unknown function (plasmid) [Cupriavidus taiwanensis]|uniref:Uncharacterized protein n=1 Tax=Cupriavidus taiwanensis TaxID=164546 RepID=A0A375IS98_9BURK|nr:protein of unknown function [Cupriavidus taiwanensis]